MITITAGRTTTNEELEEMLEQGNSAVFTQGVCIHPDSPHPHESHAELNNPNLMRHDSKS